MIRGSPRTSADAELESDVVGLERAVRGDPVAAYRSAGTLLKHDDLADDLRWRVERARGEAARWAASMDTSIRILRSSVETARRTASDDAVVRCTITLAGSIAIGGDIAAAERVLRDVESIAPESQRGQLLFQLGTISARAGHHQEAIELFDRTRPYFESAGDDLLMASLLGNQGQLLAAGGELLRARSTLRLARAAYVALGLDTSVSWVTHNLGRVEDHLGDVPTALRCYDEAAACLRGTTTTPWEVEVSRCDTLADAGLHEEAYGLARALATRLDDVGMSLDAAEARLAAARSLLAAGRRREAIELADRVSGEFEQQDRRPWADLARLIRIEAELTAAVPPASIDDLRKVARKLRSRLARTKALLLLARHDGSSRVPTVRREDPLELQLLATEVNAVRLDRGDRHAEALACLAAALRLAGRRRATLGSADLRSAFGVHTARLAATGRSIAERHRTAAIELDWLERGRSLSLLDAESTAATADEHLAELVGNLRIVGTRLRTATPDAEARLRADQVRLEARIRDHQRKHSAARASAPLPRDVARRARRRLAGSIAVSLFQNGDHLDAIVVGTRRTARMRLASEAEVRRSTNHVRATLAAAAQGHGTTAGAERMVGELDELLLSALDLDAVDGPLVISPPPWMFTLPWMAFPSLVDRPLTLSPSLSYLSARGLGRAERRDRPARTVAANGPGLAYGAEETKRIEALWPDMRRLTGRAATPEHVIEAAAGARCLHVAAHGHFNVANPLFSTLRLHGGSLSVNDALRRRIAPEVVILTACDAALGREHSGDELLGFPTAFLANGSHAVIAGVGLLPDTSTTARTAVALHERLADGIAPDMALRNAMEHVAGDGRSDRFLVRGALVCIGRPGRPS